MSIHEFPEKGHVCNESCGPTEEQIIKISYYVEALNSLIGIAVREEDDNLRKNILRNLYFTAHHKLLPILKAEGVDIEKFVKEVCEELERELENE